MTVGNIIFPILWSRRRLRKFRQFVRELQSWWVTEEIWESQASKPKGLIQLWTHVNEGWGIPGTTLIHCGAHGREEITGPVDISCSLTRAEEAGGAHAGGLEANAGCTMAGQQQLQSSFQSRVWMTQKAWDAPVCRYVIPVCPCIRHFSL